MLLDCFMGQSHKKKHVEVIFHHTYILLKENEDLKFFQIVASFITI